MPEPVRTLFWNSRFDRALNRHIGQDKKRLRCIFETLLQMTENPRQPALETHSLRGASKGLLSCSCGYDCRIIFRIELGKTPNSESIILINIGTHDEVY